jgi:glycosyltransferase involved in cell wall biosynthesis
MIKICSITKNKFFRKDDDLISNGPLWYEESGILGFKWNEIDKLAFIGFNEEKEFDGYKYKIENFKNLKIIGPEFKEEKRYILDRLINIFKTLIEIWKNRKNLKDIDLVFAPFFEYVVFEFFLLKIICRKAKFILYIIGDYPELNYQKNKKILFLGFLNLSQKLSSLIVDENWFITKKLEEKYKYKNSKIIYSNTLLNKFIKNAYKQFKNNTINLCFTGRFEKEKNPLILPDILKNLIEKKYNIKLILIGDGRLRKELEEKFNSYKVLEHCFFYGWIIDREKYFETLSKGDILILPSIQGEGLPVVFSEGMSQGLVITATNSGGAEEIIEDGENGFLINLDEKNLVERFVEKIEFLINNPQEFERISKNNIEKSKNWTMEKFLEIQKHEILKLLNK